MIELEIPILSMRSVLLEPVLELKKGVSKIHVPLEKQVQLAEPLVLPITEELAGNDQELVAFLKAEAGKFTYYCVLLGCSFQPDEGNAFEQATLEVTLNRMDGVPSPLPIVWSMQPKRDVDCMKETQSVKLTSSLKLIGIELSDGNEVDVQQEFVVAFGERTANPRWVFSATWSRRIFGYYACTLVVRVPDGTAVQGTIEMSTVVRRMAMKLFPYKAVGPGGSPLTFSLTSSGMS